MEAPVLFGPGTDLRRFLRWCVTWVVLPNIGYLPLWYFGCPLRGSVIVLLALAGLVLKPLPYAPRALLYTGLMFYSALHFISGLFDLSMHSLYYSLRYWRELEVSSSTEYVVATTIWTVTTLAGLWCQRKDSNFKTAWFVPFSMLPVALLVIADYEMGKDMRGHYSRFADPGAPFDSAVRASGFAVRADGRRDLILIIMESLGQPVGDARIRAALFAPFRRPQIATRYQLTQGTSPFYASTTSGEVRELCGRWGDFTDYLDRRASGCLPAQLARKGYETHAINSFSDRLFSRRTFYPNIGFHELEFWDGLQRKGVTPCGGVFAGACDRDVPRVITQELKEARQPRFLYWLTVNAHLPVDSQPELGTDHCERWSPYLARKFPMICRQLKIHDDIQSALAREIMAPDFPDADILIVGDHMPPYFARSRRKEFDPARVPWLYLRRKDGRR
jgi:hypothetical protein